MPYQARCTNKNCGQLLFDVPDFEAFKKPAPVEITCRGCGQHYKVSQDGDDIVYRRPQWKKGNCKKAARYG